jgi:hypothetical protein
MVNTKKELRDAGNELAKRNAVKEDLTSSGSSPARNKSDQAISLRTRDGECERASDPGLKYQASSNKRQASSTKHQAFEPTCSIAKRQASQPE